jgi:hypothetical protein
MVFDDFFPLNFFSLLFDLHPDPRDAPAEAPSRHTG